MTQVINVANLQRTSEVYDPVLRTLPYNQLKPRLLAMGFRFLSSDKELREASFERKGAITKPYIKGTEDPVAEEAIGKIKEAKLVPEWGHTSLVEDIMNYEDVNVIGNSPEHVDPKTKKHPVELLICSSAVKTVGEDLLDAVYHAERDEEGDSPFELFDGIHTHLDTLVAAGDITTAKGNLVSLSALAAPVDDDDTNCYDYIVNFLRSAHNSLKRAGAILKMSQTVYFYAITALGNKYKYKSDKGFEVLLESLKGDAAFANLSLSIEPEMGTGTRLILTTRQNFDFSLWTESSSKFCQVRNPFKNPNLVQYWLQFKAGTRVRNHHPKMLMMSDGTVVANQLSGDYLS